DEGSRKRLAEFLMLNPHDRRSYAAGLDRLLEEISGEDDGLQDNLLLEKAMLVDDTQRRSQLLEELVKRYPHRDAGVRAQYEWGVAKIKLWKDWDGSEEEKKQLLIDSRRILSDFIEKHAECPFSEQAAEMLQTLPQPQ
ncbi:MAG: hypothetical protein ACYSU8_11125, partial [Planctomycetota bacterium]